MTPADLARQGRLLYGPCWQGELAKALGVSRRLVVYWVAGERGMPVDLPERLARVARERRREIQGTLAALEDAHTVHAGTSGDADDSTFTRYLRELEAGIATVEASVPTPEELDRLYVAMTGRLAELARERRAELERIVG